MSIIPYDLLTQTMDKRVVKTKRVVFRALLSLLQDQSVTDVTVTDVCRLAMINRKTFYSHYESPIQAFLDMESLIIQGYIAQLKTSGVILAPDFQASLFIRRTHALIQDNPDDFRILYPYFRSGTFIRDFGIALGKEIAAYTTVNPRIRDVENFIFSYVFSITGLLVSYFDWIDSDYPVDLEHLENTADHAFSVPLKTSLQI